jgi:hypothetical protein
MVEGADVLGQDFFQRRKKLMRGPGRSERGGGICQVGSFCRREGERRYPFGFDSGMAVGWFWSWARSVPRGPFHVFFPLFFLFFFSFLISSITSSNLVQIDSNQFLKVARIQGNKSGQ